MRFNDFAGLTLFLYLLETPCILSTGQNLCQTPMPSFQNELTLTGINTQPPFSQGACALLPDQIFVLLLCQQSMNRQ